MIKHTTICDHKGCDNQFEQIRKPGEMDMCSAPKGWFAIKPAGPEGQKPSTTPYWACSAPHMRAIVAHFASELVVPFSIYVYEIVG